MHLPKLKNLIKSISLSFLLLFLTSLTFSPKAHAISLIVSPPRHDISIQPGEKIQKNIKVTNQEDTPLTLDLFIQDYVVFDDSGTTQKVPPEEAGRYVASPWFTADKQTLKVQPKQSETITVLIQTPQDALPGGHYTGVYFQPQNTTVPETSGPQTFSQVGSLFAINVAGDINFDTLIKSFQTDKKFYEFGPVDFQAIIENQSDTHISPKATLTIKDTLGRELETLSFQKVNIFPFTSRTIKTTWDQTWGLGRYEATLTVPFGEGSTETATILFWIVPYKIIAVAILIILALIAIIIIIRRHLKHRQDSRDKEIDSLKRKIAQLQNKNN